IALSAFIVHVEKKPGLSFGEIMRNARFWLDRHQIEAVSFKPVTSAGTGVGFDIGSASRTTRFFSSKHSVNRISIGFERLMPAKLLGFLICERVLKRCISYQMWYQD